MGGNRVSFSVFTILFITTTVLLYYIVPARLRAVFLLLVSWYFIAHTSPRGLYVLIAMTAFAYGAGVLLEREKRIKGADAKGVILPIAVTVCILLLALYKYLPGLLVTQEAQAETFLTRLAMPLGFSYYVFQIISYLADIRTGRIEAEKNPVHLALFLAFFPKFLSGPIERATDLMPQIKNLHTIPRLKEDRLSSAFAFLLYGYFLKLMVADRIAPCTSLLLNEPDGKSRGMLLIGIALYTINLYTDFAGYSAIATGCAALFGINISDNFRSPFFAKSITEFWRRWHRSLSFFLRDYVYIPLGGNRKGTLVRYRNLLIVFVLCGLWHGEGSKFLVWGLMHGVVMICEALSSVDKKAPAILNLPRSLLTFALVALFFLPFGSVSLAAAWRYLQLALTGGAPTANLLEEAAALGMEPLQVLIAAISMAAILLMDVLGYARNDHFARVLGRGHYVPRYLFCSATLLLILVFGAYGPGFDAGAFMYMEF